MKLILSTPTIASKLNFGKKSVTKEENKQHLQHLQINKDSIMPKSENLGMYRVLKSDIDYKDHQNNNIDSDVFFIRMAWYKKNKDWAEKMKALTLETSELISSNEDFETILKNIENNVYKINDNKLFGYRRTESMGAYTIFEDGRGEEYFTKYNEKLYNLRVETLIIEPEGKYIDANTVEIIPSCDRVHITHHRKDASKSNLELVQKTYEELKQIKNPSIETVLEKTATIRWLIAQENPYYRGNESVATVLERAIFHSYGIENIKYKKQVSPDFEAFYRKLDEFIEVYPELFEKKPEFI